MNSIETIVIRKILRLTTVKEHKMYFSLFFLTKKIFFKNVFLIYDYQIVSKEFIFNVYKHLCINSNKFL